MKPYYFHRVRYPDGTVSDGIVDHVPNFLRMGVGKVDGLSVLDVGCNDGGVSFFAESAGASRVVALDVGNYNDYDWGPGGLPAGVEKLQQQDKWLVFDEHHAKLKSRVVKKQGDVYNLGDENFDVVFCLGVVYHLRNPVLAIEKCLSVCNGYAVFDTEAIAGQEKIAISVEAGPHTSVAGITDHVIPTEASFLSWIWKAGGRKLFLYKLDGHSRRAAVVVKDDRFLEKFRDNSKWLLEIDESYWDKVRVATREWLKR